MRIRLMAAALFVAAMLSSPTRAAPCAGFADVVDTDPFCPSIAWMKNRAITLGCGTGANYCPADLVRRDQMAAFMYRLGFQNAFLKGGNAFGGTAVLGTTDGHGVDVVANGTRVMSYRPDATSPNIVGGHPNNGVAAAASGQVVAGGGAAGATCLDPATGLSNRTCANESEAGWATVGGGRSNIASAMWATVAGGNENTASHLAAAVVGGMDNIASGASATVAGGFDNRANGNSAATLGGIGNLAGGDLSIAMGRYTNADRAQCFLYGAWSTTVTFDCLGSSNIARFGADHGFSVDYFSQRQDGGGTRWVYVGDIFAGRTINTWNGAHLTDAGVWVNASSSRDAKTDFASVDAQDVLAKVAALPITTWRYREGEGGVRHIGPMAEDFHAAFGVGYGPHTIADLDARGVALAAIQALHRQLRERDARVTMLEARLARLQGVVEQLVSQQAEARQ